MPENNDNLKQAIKEGNVDQTKSLLESGASLPRQYTYHELPENEKRIARHSSNRIDFNKSLNAAYAEYVPKKLEDFSSSILSNNNVDEAVADNLANMFSQVNQFDYALSKAVNGGFIESRKIDVDYSTNKVVEWKEPTDMLKERRKLASFVLNHYASDEDNKIDVLSRFKSLKESIDKTDPNREAWHQTYNLITKHIDLGKEQNNELATSNQKQTDDDNPPIANITIRTNSANSSLVSFDNSVAQSDGSVARLNIGNDTAHIEQPAKPPIEPPAFNFASFQIQVIDLDDSNSLEEQVGKWTEKVSKPEKQPPSR